MRLFKEVPLETAEQAEALPDGTILRGHRPGSGFYRGPRALGFVTRYPGRPNTYTVGVDNWPLSRVLASFRTALVPIEAEEEWAARTPGGMIFFPDGEEAARSMTKYHAGAHVVSRAFTPWEPA